MKKRTVQLLKCKPGMRLAEDIFTRHGTVIISSDTILDEEIIERLDYLGFNKVSIYNDSEETIEMNYKNIKRINNSIVSKSYNENVKKIKEVLYDIANGNDISVEKINNVSDSVFINFSENKNIVDCIHEIRAVDEYTYTHCIDVALLSMLIGKWSGMNLDELKILVQSGLLHDIGKSKIPDEILNKPGKLTDEEFEVIKKHTEFGFEIIKSNDIPDDIGMAALMHHEREDGSGYLQKLASSKIHKFAKIVAVADVYDAMTSNRVYRSKRTPFEVINHIMNNEVDRLDKSVVDIFVNNIAYYYLGDRVTLSSGDEGEIVFINPGNIARPIIKVRNRFVDLSKEKKLEITNVIRQV